MRIEMYNKLPKESVQIRTDVFVKEQGFQEEFDSVDKNATHIVIFESNKPIATCRFFYNGKKNMYVIGRIAVIKEYRGQNFGAVLMKAAESGIMKLGQHKCGLSAQLRVSGFYEKQGYVKSGDPYMDEDCPHVWMQKVLG